jgi:tetratricopeptide (TPR) repeat protein
MFIACVYKLVFCNLQGNDSFKRKQWSKAIEFYSEAIELNDTNATYYCNRAAAYLELGRYTFYHSLSPLLSEIRTFKLCTLNLMQFQAS